MEAATARGRRGGLTLIWSGPHWGDDVSALLHRRGRPSRDDAGAAVGARQRIPWSVFADMMDETRITR